MLQACQTISGEIVLPRLLEKLLGIMLAQAFAQRGVLVLEHQGQLRVKAEADVERVRLKDTSREALDHTTLVAKGIVYYVARTEEVVVLGDAAAEGPFTHDPYVRRQQPKSVLCVPMLCQGKLMGVVYLENNRLRHVFTEARVEIFNLLATQAAISIANARFHAVQLQAIRAKVNPHFLFNALSSADVAVSDGKAAETAVVKLAHLYRYMLTNASDELVTMERELEVVRSYLLLEKLRFGARLEFEIATEGDVDDIRLPGLLIQPLVENCIRHGIAPKLGPGRISVRVQARGKRCCITVHDDGEGSPHATSGTGFGLKSVQERLRLVYGDTYSFAIARTDGHTVDIEIPTSLPQSPPRATSVRSMRLSS